MNDKNKRILWLINHTTLREFEVPLLISLGYEVYTPKCIPDFIYEWSGSVDYTYDSTLSIPKETLDILNQYNFYENEIDPLIISIINQYFGAVFCVFYPKILEQMAFNYNGKILLRAFGLDKTNSYTNALNAELGPNFLKRLQLLGNRFWFSQAYDNLHDIEDPILQTSKIYHPLGLSDKFFENRDNWVGGVNKILFFCARIKTASYYGSIYKNFKENFSDIPHTIAGNQPITIDDPSVAGYQSRETIEKWFSTYNVMFYHSEEPRHLHYHPLEAIVHGMPLIFMKNGILGTIGNIEQPGACKTFKEAREKIDRVLKNDIAFINEIRQKQVALLEPFTLEYCRKIWRSNFVEKIMEQPSTYLKQSIKTIGVFLPVGYRGGSLNGAKNIAKMLHIGSRIAGEPVNVVFSCVANEYNIPEDFADLIEIGISIRETDWKTISYNRIKNILNMCGMNQTPINHAEYSLPMHGNSNFNECDFWLIVSDRTIKPLAPLKPYGMVIYDYIQRYVPEIFNSSFSDDAFLATARQANFVLTTTPNTREDAIQYAGLTSYRTHLAPMEFDVSHRNTTPHTSSDDFFIWPSNLTPHKNHRNAIKALDIYYRQYNGKLKVLMTGSNTDIFNKTDNDDTINPYIAEVIALIEKLPHVRNNLKIVGNLLRDDYFSQLQAAKFLWHPAQIDNGTYAVVEAAWHGVPSLSSNYPQMHYINDRFQLNLSFCQAMQPHDMAMQLKHMEETHLEKRQRLPTQEFLEQFSYKNVAPEYWNLIRGLI